MGIVHAKPDVVSLYIFFCSCDTPTNDVQPSPPFNPIPTIKPGISPRLNIPRAHAADLGGNEEDRTSTGQFRALVPTAQVPLHGREEEAAESTDEEAKSVELGDIVGPVLRQGEDTPE